MFKITLALCLAAAIACPRNWNNPCVITSSSDMLRPRNFVTCPSSEFIDQVSGGIGSYYWNMMFDYTDFSGRPGGGRSSSCSGLGCEFYGSSHGIYAQQCSAICTNHPKCTAFTWQVNQGSTGGCRWRNTNDCWGNIPTSTGGAMGGGWMRGICRLFKSCSPDKYVSYRPSNGAGVKLWHLGAGDGGRCSRPGNKNLDISRGPSACDSGEELVDRKCRACPSGTWKFGLNANRCQKCRTCSGSEYSKSTCSGKADTVCYSHSAVCKNHEYQTIAPTAKNDRSCEACKSCPAGSMISYGCNNPDPWWNQKWTSGKGAISVYQNQKVNGKPVIFHDSNKNKAGCGILKAVRACPKEDPWLGQGWASDSKGTATITANKECVSQSIKNHVVLVHDSKKNKVGCGKLIEVSTGKFEAQIEPTSSYGGFRHLRGLFKLNHHDTRNEFTGTATLAGLESSASGVWHVHEGTTCKSPGGHLLNPQLALKAEITTYPGYKSKVSGSVFMRQTGTQLVGKYEVNGLSGTGMIHVHSGSSCSSPGGHLLNDQRAAHVHKLNRRLVEAAHPGKSKEQSKGNTQCTPCVPGAGFAATANSARCEKVTSCKAGTYETKAATAVADRVCGRCTNGPSNSYYTTAGSTVSNCEFKCNKGYALSNDGTECAKASNVPEIKFEHNDGSSSGSITAYGNDVLQFNGFKCVDSPKFCGKTQLSTLQTELDALTKKVEGLQAWGRCITAKGLGKCEF